MKPATDFAARQPMRGYHVEYRGDGSDRCPGCGRQHFYIGRITAECGFCGTAVPLPQTVRIGAGCFRIGRAVHV